MEFAEAVAVEGFELDLEVGGGLAEDVEEIGELGEQTRKAVLTHLDDVLEVFQVFAQALL